MDALALSFGLALSTHLLPGDWHEVHPLARLDGPGWAAGVYLNSERRASAFVAVTSGDGPVWWEAGAVTGYSGARVAPFVRAGIEIAPAVNLFAAPAYKPAKRKAGIVVGLEITSSRRN